MTNDAASGPTDEIASMPDTSSPAYASGHPVTKVFDAFASLVTRWAGSPLAFCLAVAVVVAWVVTGPLFHYSDGWQLVINTGTTIITFLMVFLIQQSQNKDSVAVHLKLNELLAANHAASNRLIGIEDASEEDLRRIANAYFNLVKKAGERNGRQDNVDSCVEEARRNATPEKEPADRNQHEIAS
ncbi:low affinity iron permease family protein [Paraburkholderia fungorum]|uniref:low affinity iron permease family protein n=1 Tax=Paraburkholderia fungorum TaxID=134537 RepID=UPI001C1ED7F0|nr:low affinity iron permease family protein [Paraburkholderia fungorum]